MEFNFNLNEYFRKPIVEIKNTLLPPDFAGDRRALWNTVNKVAEVVNEIGEASAQAQGLNKPITTAERLRQSDQNLYLLVDHDVNNGNGAVTGMLKIGRKGLYVFDRDGKHYQVSPPCVLDFYVHEKRQRTGLGKKLFEYMLENENVKPHNLAIDRPSEKFLNFLTKHYDLKSPIKQMNNYVVFDGFFPDRREEETQNSPINRTNGSQIQPTNTPSYGRYGAPRPPCSMGQIIHNTTSQKNSEPASRKDMSKNEEFAENQQKTYQLQNNYPQPQSSVNNFNKGISHTSSPTIPLPNQYYRNFNNAQICQTMNQQQLGNGATPYRTNSFIISTPEARQMGQVWSIQPQYQQNYQVSHSLPATPRIQYNYQQPITSREGLIPIQSQIFSPQPLNYQNQFVPQQIQSTQQFIPQTQQWIPPQQVYFGQFPQIQGPPLPTDKAQEIYQERLIPKESKTKDVQQKKISIKEESKENKKKIETDTVHSLLNVDPKYFKTDALLTKNTKQDEIPQFIEHKEKNDETVATLWDAEQEFFENGLLKNKYRVPFHQETQQRILSPDHHKFCPHQHEDHNQHGENQIIEYKSQPQHVQKEVVPQSNTESQNNPQNQKLQNENIDQRKLNSQINQKNQNEFVNHYNIPNQILSNPQLQSIRNEYLNQYNMQNTPLPQQIVPYQGQYISPNYTNYMPRIIYSPTNFIQEHEQIQDQYVPQPAIPEGYSTFRTPIQHTNNENLTPIRKEHSCPKFEQREFVQHHLNTENINNQQNHNNLESQQQAGSQSRFPILPTTTTRTFNIPNLEVNSHVEGPDNINRSFEEPVIRKKPIVGQYGLSDIDTKKKKYKQTITQHSNEVQEVAPLIYGYPPQITKKRPPPRNILTMK